MTGLVESTTPDNQSERGDVRDVTEPIPPAVPARRDGGGFAAVDGWRRGGWLVCGVAGGLAIVWFILLGPGETGSKADWFFGAVVFCAVMVALWQLVLTQKLHTAEMESQYKAHRAEMDAQRQQARLDRSHLLNQLQKQR